MSHALFCRAALLAFGMLCAGCERAADHPSSARLQQQWRDHHTDLEQLVKMFRADKALNRVAPDFTRPDDPSSIGVTSARIAEYRQLLRKAGVATGIEGYNDKDAITFIVSALGLGISGSGKGFAYLEGTPELLVPDLDAHISQAHAKHAESFTAYQRISGDWYLYYDHED